MIMCIEVLSLANAFNEIHCQMIDNNTYWDMLSSTTTKLGQNTSKSNDSINHDTLSRIAASIFDCNKKSIDNYIVEYPLLDDNGISALNNNIVNTRDREINTNDLPNIE